jgi:dolichol-phosphate mannosyltransferase
MNVIKVIIIIPTYNEALTIENTIFQVFKSCAAIPNKEIHILIFDSASTDDTQKIILDLQINHPNLHLKTEPKKSGLGSAYLQAMRFALSDLSADIIFEFDADLSHQPKYIAPMLEAMETHDVVLGSRYVPGGEIPSDWGWHRKVLSKLGNYIARFILTPKYKDFTTGFRATRRDVLIKILPHKFISNQFAYKLELLWLLHKNKSKIREYPIAFVDRKDGLSKLPTNSIIDALKVIFTLRLRAFKPYFKMCLVGFSGAIIQGILYNLLRHKLPPLSSAQIAALGAILNNFILNNQFTFRKNRLKFFHHKTLQTLGFFIGYSSLMIAGQSYWLYLGVKYFGTGSLQENALLVTGIILGSSLNYLIYSQLIWRTRPATLVNEDA